MFSFHQTLRRCLLLGYFHDTKLSLNLPISWLLAWFNYRRFWLLLCFYDSKLSRSVYCLCASMTENCQEMLVAEMFPWHELVRRCWLLVCFHDIKLVGDVGCLDVSMRRKRRSWLLRCFHDNNLRGYVGCDDISITSICQEMLVAKVFPLHQTVRIYCLLGCFHDIKLSGHIGR